MAKKKSTNWAIIGVGGYIAPRHLEAIANTGGKVLAACDIHDSVGILDKWHPEAEFFKEIERFDRRLDKGARGLAPKIDWLAVCTPNWMHDYHVRMGLRNDCNVLVEKPPVLNERNLDGLIEAANESGKEVRTVLQLRLHPVVEDIRREFSGKAGLNVELTYITPRGPWYERSWKGNPEMSGGPGTNIGIHMFDILMHLFGPPIDKRVDFNNGVSRMGGRIYAASADISWALSLQREDADRRTALKLPCRAIKVENKVFNLDSGFTDLHTRVYEETLAGNGWTLEDARPSVRLCEWIRDEEPVTRHLGTHPLVQVWQGPFNPGQGN